MDNTEIDTYLLDIFKNQYDKQLAIIQTLINGLSSVKTYKENVNQLFRMFHNFKSSTSYLGLETMKELIVEVENVLEVLRTQNAPAQNEIIQWFYNVAEQLFLWQDELQNDIKPLSSTPKDLFNSIRLAPSNIKVADTLKSLQLLYIDPHKKRSEKVVTFLKNISPKITHKLSIKNIDALNSVDICIVNIDKYSLEKLNIYQNKLPDTQLLIIADKVTEYTASKLISRGIYNFLDNATLKTKLARELYNLTNSYFSGRRILINNERIHKFIQNLEPLSSSVFKIQAICSDADASIHQLTQTIKQDPIITSTILSATKSPIYGLKNIKTIDQAVSIFGKKTVQSIVFSGLSQNIGVCNLDAYNINENIFSHVSTLRLALMLQWAKQVSANNLNILSLSSILGNIGQLLLGEEIQKQGKTNHFISEAALSGFQVAEEKILHTSTAYISSEILDYWKLDSTLADSIRYSDRPLEAPKSIQNLCILNHIVFNTVLLDGSINKVISKEILGLMKKGRLHTQPLIKAIEYISQI